VGHPCCGFVAGGHPQLATRVVAPAIGYCGTAAARSRPGHGTAGPAHALSCTQARQPLAAGRRAHAAALCQVRPCVISPPTGLPRANARRQFPHAAAATAGATHRPHPLAPCNQTQATLSPHNPRSPRPPSLHAPPTAPAGSAGTSPTPAPPATASPPGRDLTATLLQAPGREGPRRRQDWRRGRPHQACGGGRARRSAR
jgi:hypothetical protein